MRDPRVDLISLHNLPRYIAIGVDPNDAQRLLPRIERWEDWCRCGRRKRRAMRRSAVARTHLHRCRRSVSAQMGLTS